ncbi:MAG: 7-cyano-7-deazaguanine synthase QueC [Planctomycetota bacterium]
MSERAVVLLSGGLDSTTCACWARREGYEVHALSVDYGQRHRLELERAARVAQALGLPHRVVRVDLGDLGGSALTDAGIEVPKDRADDPTEIPVTYVPARNTVFLSVALGYAEVLDARALVIGANAVDYSGYPDCRPAFLQAFERLANVATRSGVEGRALRVLAPLLHLSKAEIVRLGLELDAPYALTVSCYDPQGERACGHCDACRLRLAGFAGAGSTDPVPYV